MRSRVASDFAQFLDDMRRRRSVGIAHAKIDNVLPSRPRRSFHRVHFCKNIGRQPLDAIEIGVHGCLFSRVR
jgi:hypothetical protein